LGISTFLEACRWVHALPYGYNADRDDPTALFREHKGTCTTKHGAIAALAAELGLPVEKHLGIYALTEEIVTGAGAIIARHGLPYVPLTHCFLSSGAHCVDLTEGNRNGKNRPIEEFLVTRPVPPFFSEKEEYLWYRGALTEVVLVRPEWRGIELAQVLHARQDALELLRALVARG
jgi:hypothetical protein